MTAGLRALPLQENPLVDGLERLPVHPTALVIFGATGDLARCKLLAAARLRDPAYAPALTTARELSPQATERTTPWIR